MTSLRWMSQVAATALLLAYGNTLHAQQEKPSAGLINRTGILYSAHNSAIYVVDNTHGALVVLRAGQPPKLLRTGPEPLSIATNEHTGRVYVASLARSVTVIDGTTDEILATIPTAASPYAIAVDQTTDRVFISNTFSDRMTIIDGKTNTARNVRTGSADALVVDEERGKVYLLGYESESLTVFDEATDKTSKLETGAIHQWAIAKAGSRLFVSHIQDADLAVIDLDDSSSKRIPTGRMPCAFAMDSSHRELYVVSYADSSVTAVDIQSAAVRWTLPLGAGHPQSIAVDPVKRRVYVGDAQGRTVTVLDAVHHQILRKLALGDSPYALAVDRLSGHVVAATTGSAAYVELTIP